jgi:hypothetical protein
MMSNDAQNPAGADYGKRIMDIRLKANSFQKAAQEMAKAYYDWKRGKSWRFKEGDLVWLESTNIMLSLSVKKLAPQ